MKRLTVVDGVYHASGGKVEHVNVPFSRPIRSDEQAYKRCMKLKPGDTPLDVGWLKDDGVGMLVLTNAGDHPVILSAVTVKFAVLAAGESCRFQPIDPANLVLTCEQPTTVDVFAVPL